MIDKLLTIWYYLINEHYLNIIFSKITGMLYDKHDKYDKFNWQTFNNTYFVVWWNVSAYWA